MGLAWSTQPVRPRSWVGPHAVPIPARALGDAQAAPHGHTGNLLLGVVVGVCYRLPDLVFTFEGAPGQPPVFPQARVLECSRPEPLLGLTFACMGNACPCSVLLCT